MNKFSLLYLLATFFLTFVVILFLQLFEKLENIFFPVIFLAFVGANIADVYSSYLCMNTNNVKESNPVVRFFQQGGIIGLIFLKLISILTVLICMFLWIVLGGFPFIPWFNRIPLILVTVFTLAIFGASLNNFLLVKRG